MLPSTEAAHSCGAWNGERSDCPSPNDCWFGLVTRGKKSSNCSVLCQCGGISHGAASAKLPSGICLTGSQPCLFCHCLRH